MFKVPIPCNIGEQIVYKNRKYYLGSVSWFYWSYKGWDFTYSLITDINAWNNDTILVSSEDIPVSSYINIEETLLEEAPIKQHGHPLTGTGKMTGLCFRKNKFYADFLIISRYNEHILSECNENGLYNGGEVLFPATPSYDSEEKRKKAVLSSYIKSHQLYK